MNLKRTHISQSKKIKVGITLGDPSGIGPQIVAKALSKQNVRDLAQFVIIGDEWVFNKAQRAPCLTGRQAKRKAQNFRFIDLNNVPHRNFSFGQIKAEYGKASIEYIDRAIELIKNKEVDCLVTAPISKEATSLAGFKWIGHSEYLAYSFDVEDIAMMLANRYIKTSLVTRHLPLEKVPFQLDKNKIYKVILLTYRALKEWFAIKEPRLAVCGLNPHASDGGLIGKEEKEIITPAINMAKNKIKHIEGPLPSDTAFLKAKNKVYDSVVAMYHDQALIPLKVLDFNSGVNITLGLPFVRTSPLHGTGFDIAGTGVACPDSLIEAIRTAVKCTLNLKKD